VTGPGSGICSIDRRSGRNQTRPEQKQAGRDQTEKRQAMKKSYSSPLGLYVIGIAALFLAGFLMLVIFGAQTYRHTVGVQNGNNHTRATLSYVTAAVRAADTAGGVRVEEAVLDDGTVTQVLSLADGDTGYVLRIYLHEGSLMEEYARAEAPLTPSASNVIGETGLFEVEKDGPVLRVRTDEGSVLVHLRAG